MKLTLLVLSARDTIVVSSLTNNQPNLLSQSEIQLVCLTNDVDLIIAIQEINWGRERGGVQRKQLPDLTNDDKLIILIRDINYTRQI